MEITRVNVYPVKSDTKIRAFATICIDDELVVKNFKIFDGNKGLFVSFPSEVGADNKYYDTVYPVSKETRDYISDSILEEFEKTVDKKEDTPTKRGSRRSSR